MTRTLASRASPPDGPVPDQAITPRAAPEVDPTLLATRLKRLIGAESVSSFARRSGVGESVLRSYLADHRMPSLDKALADGITLGISPSPPYSNLDPNTQKADGLDVEINEAALHWLGIDTFIPKRRTQPHGLGRVRWVVERTLSWFHQFRRLRTRYDRRAEVHEAFLQLGCAMICWNFLK